MSSNEYVLSDTLYLVIYIDGQLNRYMPLGVKLTSSRAAVCVFTEELHAERAMNLYSPGSVIWKLSRRAEMPAHILLFENMEFDHVAVDPYLEAGPGNPCFTTGEFNVLCHR